MDETAEKEKKQYPANTGEGYCRSRWYLWVSVIAVILGAILWNEMYEPHTAFHGTKVIDISPGLGSRQIADLLKHEGLIRSKWMFETYVTVRNEASSLKPGNYTFFDSSTIRTIARDLVDGGTVEHIAVIPEGWQRTQIATYLEKEGIISAQAFLNETNSPVQQEILARFAFLSDKPQNANLEGYLFPNTYRFFKNSPSDDIVLKMLTDFDAKLTPKLREEINRQYKSIFEIVTMASLIEKEVTSDRDRALVSGVLWKRIGAGIPLQVDATIFYALAKAGENTTNRHISIQDTKINSLYNTYTHKGLPPGPINNPGLAAIQAAISPQNSSYLFYLSAPDGTTIFSRTLEEHNRAKAKYLK